MTEVNGAHAPPNQFAIDLDNSPKITLAGRQFAIPVLAIKQNRIVVPGLLKLAPMMKRISMAMSSAGASVDPVTNAVTVTNKEWFLDVGISTDEFDIMCDIVHAACTRGTPGFGRGEFDGMPITVMELIEAISVVGQQTGMMARQEAARPGAGEQQPAAGPADNNQQPIPTST